MIEDFEYFMSNDQLESSYWLLYGFCLFLVIVVLWGILFLFFKICLQVMDSQIIIFYWFVVVVILVGGWLFYCCYIFNFLCYFKVVIILIIVCMLMLVINYVFNVFGFKYLSFGSVQVFMQVVLFVFMIGGIVLYKEKFSCL